MQRGVRVAACATQALVVRDDARRLIDCELLGHRKVQRQMQERIDLAPLRPVIARDVRVRGLEQRVVFGMHRRELRGGLLGRGPRLAEGMVLAIEPMVAMGRPETKVLGDGWTAVTRDGSLAAHFEHTVAVTADGPLVLSAREGAPSPATARG